MADELANLKPRKRKYVEGLALGKTKLQAALDAGYSESVARATKRKIETPEVREAFQRIIRKRIPASRIAKRIDEGMDAMETKFFQKDGAVVESRDVIAWGERRAYTELAAEFGGYHAPSKPVEASGTNVAVQVIVEHIGSADKDSPTTQAKRTVEAMG